MTTSQNAGTPQTQTAPGEASPVAGAAGKTVGSADASKAGQGTGRAATVPADGTTTLDDRVRIEVDLLALSTLDQIACEVSAAVAQAVASAPAPVVLADAALEKALRLRGELSGRAKLLADEIDSLLGAGAGVQIDAFSTVLDGLSSLATLLSFFRTDSEYKGREVAIAQTALDGALAGHLLRRGIAVRVPQRSGQADASTPDDGLFARVGRLQAQRKELASLATDDPRSPRAEALAAAADELVKVITVGDPDPAKAAVLALVPLVDALASQAARSDMYWLRADVVTAGGSYRAVRGLLARFFWADSLASSGGTAVSFTLSRMGDGVAVAADLLYLHSGFRRMPSLNPGTLLANFGGTGWRTPRPFAQGEQE